LVPGPVPRSGLQPAAEPDMVEAGMPSREAIKAATVNAAKLLDLSDEVGTIASGKSADVIAVDSSPLDDVSVLERVAFVMARGDVYRA
jgi:imidazolonepropionase-like amidohydrolase